MMKFNHFISFTLLLLIGFSSCTKDTTQPKPLDPRDKVVGEYEVWDSLYKYVDTDTSGKLIHELVGVFHYTKVSIVKSKVMQETGLGTQETDGLSYIVNARDTTIYGKNGERQGFFGSNVDFIISTTDPVTLSGAEYVFLRSQTGELKNGYLSLTAGEYMIGYSSAKAVKIR